MQDTPKVQVAHSYAARGWCVIALHGVTTGGRCTCGETEPGHAIGKHPRERGWQNLPRPSGADIEELWAKWPDANIGLATGDRSGFWVLDIDPEREGFTSLEALVSEHGSDWMQTYTVKTGSGGVHLYFALPNDFTVTNSPGRLPPGIDVRGQGGQVVAPPSVTDKGGYVCATRSRVSEVPIAAAPTWLLDLIRPPARRVAVAAGGPQRSSEEIRRYVEPILAAEIDRVLSANGERNNALNRATFSLAQLVPRDALDLELVREAMTAAGEATGLGAREVRKTVESAVKAGLAQPREPWPPVGLKKAQTPFEAVTEAAVSGRRVRLTAACEIEVRPVEWLWSERIALGTLALLGGREGIGKSTVAYDIAAGVSRGTLSGAYEGEPRSVLVAAAEDSWEHTIVPRLMAAGADLSRVYRIDVETGEDVVSGLILPEDLKRLEQAVTETDAALILLDPLMSRLDASLDTHKDAEVRTALEPLVKVADDTGAAILGLIHVNKSHSTDPLTTLMASRAFAAVARGVLFAMADPEDESMRLLGQPKNNLGRVDLPTLTFRIVSAHVTDTAKGPVFTGKVDWVGETDRSIRDAMENSSDGFEVHTQVAEAGDWLKDYLTSAGGTAESARIKAEGKSAGYSANSLKRAGNRLKLAVEQSGFPRRTYWRLPDRSSHLILDVQSDHSSGTTSGESTPIGPIGPTGYDSGTVGPVGPVGPMGLDPARDGPTVNVQSCEICGATPDRWGAHGGPLSKPCQNPLAKG